MSPGVASNVRAYKCQNESPLQPTVKLHGDPGSPNLNPFFSSGESNMAKALAVLWSHHLQPTGWLNIFTDRSTSSTILKLPSLLSFFNNTHTKVCVYLPCMGRPHRTSGITSGPSLPSSCNNTSSFIPWCPNFPWVPTLVPLSVVWAIWFLHVYCPLNGQPWRTPQLPEIINLSFCLMPLALSIFWMNDHQQWWAGDTFIPTLHCSSNTMQHTLFFDVIDFTPFPYKCLLISPHNHKDSTVFLPPPKFWLETRQVIDVDCLQKWLPTILFIFVKVHCFSHRLGGTNSPPLESQFGLVICLTNRIQVLFCEF